MLTPEFYPALNKLISSDSLPEPIKSAIDSVFSKLFYKTYYVEKSVNGDAAYHHLILIFDEVGFNLFGGEDGFEIIFNPGSASGTTELPISIYYNLPILKYVRKIKLENLSSVKDYFDLILEMFDISKKDILFESIMAFEGEEEDPAQAFIDDFNSNPVYSTFTPLTLPELSEDFDDEYSIVESLVTQFQENNLDLKIYILETYINIADISAGFENLSLLFKRWLGEFSQETLMNLFIPKFSVSIKVLEIALAFPRTWLKPVNPVTFEVIDDENLKSMLTFNVGSMQYSSETGFKFINPGAFSLTPSQIGNTGIICNFTNIFFDFDRSSNIPQVISAGGAIDFIGIFIEQAEIFLPKKWFSNPNSGEYPPGFTSIPPIPSIKGTNLLIGTGGISGTIGLFGNGVLYKKIGNFWVGLDAFSLTFNKNSIINSNISGSLILANGGFKDANGDFAKISVNLHIEQDGDFSITASETTGITLRIPNVFDFTISSLTIGKQDGRYFAACSGSIKMTFQIPTLNIDPPIEVDIKKLLIWDDGQIEIEGGNIVLPKALTLKIGPVKLSVTAISLGSYERNGRRYKYFGFDGGVNVNPGGVDVKASGIKVYYSIDNDQNNQLDIFVRVEGIAIDLIIPGSKSADDATVLLKGFIQMKEPATTDPNARALTEYGGGVSFQLPKVGIGGSAAMRMIPSLPAFIIDTELSISVPIPLGNTSLGIYGFRGLIGFRYVADKKSVSLPDDASWYEYYKAKVALSYKEGITVDKFSQRKGFAIGAGVTLGTLTDSGKAFSAKIFLLLSLPDALLLQGQAAIMSTRVDLSPNDPPFSVLIAITKQSVEAAFGVDYLLPEDTGAILNVQALIEMGFFFNDSSAWYINIGRDVPASKRVTARILNLFDAWTYLMISGSGIKAGAGVSWDFSRNFGPVGLEAHVYLDTQGQISFKPKQIGAVIHLGGSVAVKVFKFKLGLSIAASLAAEAPHPFIVTGSANVRLDLPKPFKKLGGDFQVDFTWTFDSTPPEATPTEIFNQASVSEAAKAVNIVTRERFDLNVLSPAYLDIAIPPAPTNSAWIGSFAKFVVPLDSTIDIEFKKPIAPGSGTGNIGITGTGYNNVELVPPQKGKSPQVQHKYVVEDVKIRSWNPVAAQWQDYDIYEALTPLQHLSFLDPNDLFGLKQGWWQIDNPNKLNKLSLLSQTPLNYTNDTSGSFIPENSGVTGEKIYCPEDKIEEICIPVDNFKPLTLIGSKRYTIQNVQFRITGKDGILTNIINPFGFRKGVVFEPGSQLEIFFPQLTGHVDLKISTLADDVKVFYMRHTVTGYNSSNAPVYTYKVIKQEILTATNLLKKITYDNLSEPIDKVVIIAGKCKCKDETPCDCCDDQVPAGSSTMGSGILNSNLPLITKEPIFAKSLTIGTSASSSSLSTVDLKPAQLNSLNIGISRNKTSKKDELNPKSSGSNKGFATPPIISYNLLLDTSNYISRTLYVEIFDGLGLNFGPSTKPRLYYKKISNLNTLSPTNDNTTDGWKYSEASNTSNPFIFIIDYSITFGGVAPGDVIQYFVVAQDTASIPNVGVNSGIFSSPPTSIELTPANFPISGVINNYTLVKEFIGNETPCGSIAAHLFENSAVANNLVIIMNVEYDELIRRVKDNQQLCKKYKDKPEIGTLYCHKASELKTQADKLKKDIENLKIYIGRCNEFLNTTGYIDSNSIATPNIEQKAANVLSPQSKNPQVNYDLSCKTIFFGLCWMPISSQIFNSTLPTFEDVLHNNDAMVTAITNTIRPIWRPDTQYAVSIRVIDHVNVLGTNNSSSIPKYMHIGFSTIGGIGHFHQARNEYNELVTEDRANEYRLQSLKPYIDYTKSYPNPDGNILNAKPLFYNNPKLQVFYIHQFVYTMYGGQFDAYNGNSAVTSKLDVTIHDPVNPLPTGPTDHGYIGEVSLSFQANDLGHVTPDVQILNNMATRGDPCTQSGKKGIKPIGIQSNITVDNLKPLKLYLAVFKATCSAVLPENQVVEVHRYNFQTSRYADFSEMINSYQLKDKNGVYVKDAIFDDIAVTLDATRSSQLSAMLTNSYPPGDPLIQQYADNFDRLIDGILQVGPVDPPVSTDFNIIRDSSNNNVIGILVRNSEPFNDPKIKDDYISQTITLSQDSGPTSAFRVICSKDRSKAFIGDPNMNLILADLTFTFKYLEYNGVTYEDASTVVVNLFVTPQ